MITELNKIQERKHIKLMRAHQNNITLSNMNLQDKFTNFEDSKLSESKTLLYEVEKKPKKFKRYARGRIVKVKFGVNIGSEFSGDHFAIVISKGGNVTCPPSSDIKTICNLACPNSRVCSSVQSSVIIMCTLLSSMNVLGTKNTSPLARWQ